ncbi:MAG: ethanolamine ammonia-lyase subunit EutC [Pseudolabrys sp.]|nr:ethanolamine ammonia-lyase subunit EutC [Pseudolabrys sp.]MDP2296440.1 ethanolamine ammonia-lyase subunit EutC [Pseudolabrys sp.]
MSSGDDKPPALPDADPWTGLRRLTAARIGLPRSGASLATAPLLAFQLAHAQARDAVHAELDMARLTDDLGGLGGPGSPDLPVVAVESAAHDKQTYLMRPDLGRCLTPSSESMLAPHAGNYDLVFVVSDGLSARAAQMHAAPVIAAARAALPRDGWSIAPVVIIRHGRVAAGDAVARLLRAGCVAVLIGERPGLSAPDSLGVYMTWQPEAQTSDADRNCISNIRPAGIGYADAGHKLAHLLSAMRKRGVSGVSLKDDSERLQIGSA